MAKGNPDSKSDVNRGSDVEMGPLAAAESYC